MHAPPPSHLGSLREGLTLLLRRPLLALGLAVVAMALAQLGPALELAAGHGSSLMGQFVFGLAGLLPLEMYLIPRLQAELDAEAFNAPGNPAATWREVFEQRWFRAFLARLAVSLAFGLGLVMFLIPGIVILTLFGWAPMRLLLRGDDLLAALKWSQTTMARQWPRVIQAVLAMMLMLLAYQAVAMWTVDHLFPNADPELGPGALVRLNHPAFWILNLAGGAMNLWFSCALLALYHRLEGAVADRA